MTLPPTRLTSVGSATKSGPDTYEDRPPFGNGERLWYDDGREAEAGTLGANQRWPIKTCNPASTHTSERWYVHFPWNPTSVVC